MYVIITWMTLEKCLNVGSQYFFYWFSVLTFNMRRDVSQNFNQGWAKNLFFNPIYFFYYLIHLISILLKIQSM